VITTLDFETTFIKDEKGNNRPEPYLGNKLVSAGWQSWPVNPKKGYGGSSEYVCFYHQEQPPSEGAFEKLQDTLQRTALLIAHNAKFELSWLRSCGFTYNGPVFCTQVTEYVLSRGLKKSFKLVACLERRGLSPKRVDLTDDYLKDGVGFDQMPWEVVEEYGRQDVASTLELAQAQCEELGCEIERFAK